MAEENGFLFMPNLIDMVRFVNQHSTDLIRGVTVVDPILKDLLQQNLLTQEQYCATYNNSTSQMKMRELYKYVRAWSDQNKVILYKSLKKHNKQLIKYLDHQDKQPLPRREHFVDKHQHELLEKIPVEKPILYCLAEEGLLTYKERGTIEAKESPPEKVSMLYSYISRWSNREKDALYDILEEWNGPIIKLLKEKDEKQRIKPTVKHFVDRHRRDLINWVYELQPVLDSLLNQNLLTKEQFDSICSKKTSQDKMTELYCVVGGWGDGDKDKLYDSLRKYNRLLIGDLEYKDRELPPPTYTQSMKKIRNGSPKQATLSIKRIRISSSKQETPDFEDKSPILVNMVLPVQTCPPSFHTKVSVEENHHYHQKKEDVQIQEETRHKDLPVPDCKANDHFVDKYREALISRVPLVYPILERLMADNVLNNEQYDSIRRLPTTQHKMRTLYKHITDMGDAAKDKFYDALNKYNALLIKNLKGT